ncbi:hypothetical protein GE09DRAFT_1219732 [Coniochaeta sp. 2T2.1]|nr:hypothetical protein GE09DRAFT_1219732 [Coniochaeta sp. 2T2.1]
MIGADPEAPWPPPLVPWETDCMSLTNITRGMLATGHPKWGFLIYRCTYDGQADWDAFMDAHKIEAGTTLEAVGRILRLPPYLQWTVADDKASLDGASKGAVRDRFCEWVATRSNERDGPGAGREDAPAKLPWYRYCLYVDKECLDSLRRETLRSGNVWLYGHLVLIDSEFGRRDVEDSYIPSEEELEEHREEMEELLEDGISPERLGGA